MTKKKKILTEKKIPDLNKKKILALDGLVLIS